MFSVRRGKYRHATHSALTHIIIYAYLFLYLSKHALIQVLKPGFKIAESRRHAFQRRARLDLRPSARKGKEQSLHISLGLRHKTIEVSQLFVSFTSSTLFIPLRN